MPSSEPGSAAASGFSQNGRYFPFYGSHAGSPTFEPLTSHDVIVNTIAATTTRTGLTVHAELDTDTYPVGVKIPDTQMKALHDSGVLRRHDWHGGWNYTLNPPNARVEN